MFISSISLITISILLISTGIVSLVAVMRLRIMRITSIENRISVGIDALDTTRLQAHLQGIPLSVIEIDAEVASLKQDIIQAAQEHHITVDEDETQPENPFKSVENQQRLIKILEKQDDLQVLVG